LDKFSAAAEPSKHNPRKIFFSYRKFLSLYPLPQYSIDRAQRNLLYVPLPNQEIQLDLNIPDHRLYIIFLSYVYSLPPYHAMKPEIHKLYENFMQDRNDLIAWIQDLSTREPAEGEEDGYSERLKAILALARDFALQRQKQRRDRDRRGRKMGLKRLVKINIHNLIQKESGTSLYKLLREKKHLLNPPQTSEDPQTTEEKETPPNPSTSADPQTAEEKQTPFEISKDPETIEEKETPSESSTDSETTEEKETPFEISTDPETTEEKETPSKSSKDLETIEEKETPSESSTDPETTEEKETPSKSPSTSADLNL
jgi:hypothetical protein